MRFTAVSGVSSAVYTSTVGMHWLESAVGVTIMSVALSFVSARKIVTEHYRPWKGDHLSDLLVVRGPRSVKVKITEDSAEVRALLSRFRALDNSLGMLSSPLNLDPNFYTPVRRNLGDSQYFEVSGGTHCMLIERTDVRCRGNLYSHTFIKVRITSGDSRRNEGFVCDENTVRTVATL